jgi:hypothetical protein
MSIDYTIEKSPILLSFGSLDDKVIVLSEKCNPRLPDDGLQGHNTNFISMGFRCERRG